jgi:hypothetical protein
LSHDVGGSDALLQKLLTIGKIAWRHNAEDHNRHFHHCDNLKSRIGQAEKSNNAVIAY